jgi:hypothetical protein
MKNRSEESKKYWQKQKDNGLVSYQVKAKPAIIEKIKEAVKKIKQETWKSEKVSA